jgi:hypothetical protein
LTGWKDLEFDTRRIREDSILIEVAAQGERWEIVEFSMKKNSMI